MRAAAPDAQFELKDGSRLTLYANRVVHEGGGTLEIVPLGHLASVRVAFERDPRKLNWAIVLLVVALALAALSGPLQGWIAAAAARVGEGARREALDAVLLTVFGVLGGLARLLPLLAAALGAVCALLGTLFVLGTTTLTLSFAAAERAFTVRGRDRRLAEFAEILGERLAGRGE